MLLMLLFLVAIDVEDEVLLKKWRVLTGNDIGALLTVFVFKNSHFLKKIISEN